MDEFQTGLLAVGAGLAAGAALGYYFASKYQNRRKDDESVEKVFYDVLFFPDSAMTGVGDLSRQEREFVFREVMVQSRSLLKMMEYLSREQS